MALEGETEPAERRAAVAGDERGSVEPAALVGPVLIEGQAHQRLDARNEDLPLFQPILGGQGEFGRGPHAVSSRDVNARRRWTYDTGAPDGAQISNGPTRRRDDRDQSLPARGVRCGAGALGTRRRHPEPDRHARGAPAARPDSRRRLPRRDSTQHRRRQRDRGLGGLAWQHLSPRRRARGETAPTTGAVPAAWDGWRGNIYRLAAAPEARRRRLAQRLVHEAALVMRAKGSRRLS